MTERSTKSPHTIVLIGDTSPPLEQTRKQLLGAVTGAVLLCTDSQAAIAFLEQHTVSLIIFEVRHTPSSIELLERISREFQSTPLIVVSTSGTIEEAVTCMKLGAVDYVTTPTESNRLITAVENAVQHHSTQQEIVSLKECLLNNRLDHAEAFAEIITVSRRMRSLFQYTEIVAGTPEAVLITGETGVGKELFARAIHRISKVRGPFISINVAGLDDTMFSDTLFGHKKGAFTGAEQSRDGLVSKAAAGTLFLDEIGDLNELSQVKLLRLLQEREYYPVGADQVKNSTARIILATNVNLQERIKEGRFRRDLYYRLCSHQIHIPPLRERREDISVLVDHFIAAAAQHFGRSTPSVAPELLTALAHFDFPGNVRELQAKVNDAVARHEGEILTLADFSGVSSATLQPPPPPSSSPAESAAALYSLFGRLPTFREIEDYLIVEALKISEGNYAVAASILGVTRQTISKRLKSIETAS